MKKTFLNRTTLFQFFKFSIVGILATAIHYGVYLLIYKLLNVNIAYTIGYVVSFTFNFLLSNFFTFNTKPNVKQEEGFSDFYELMEEKIGYKMTEDRALELAFYLGGV